MDREQVLERRPSPGPDSPVGGACDKFHTPVDVYYDFQTHNIALAGPIADFVVALDADGRIVSRGSVADAFAHVEGLQEQVEKAIEIAVKSEEVIDNAYPKVDKVAQKGDGKLILTEEIAEGHVSWVASEQVLFSARLLIMLIDHSQ